MLNKDLDARIAIITEHFLATRRLTHLRMADLDSAAVASGLIIWWSDFANGDEVVRDDIIMAKRDWTAFLPLVGSRADRNLQAALDARSV
jgi:hypothetical protein